MTSVSFLVFLNRMLSRKFRSQFCRLKYVPRPKMRVCVLGDQQHMDEANANSIPCMDVEGLKKFQKNKKIIKKFGTRPQSQAEFSRFQLI